VNRDTGFTLLELLVALVVLGLVLVGAVQGVRFGIVGWEGQSRQINATAEIDGVDRVLRDLFQGISVSGALSFDGRPDSVTFVGSLPRAVPAQLRQAEMSLQVTADHRLVLRWRPHRHATELFTPPLQEIELARQVAGIEFAYWPQSARTGQGWQTNLSGGVPRLIRVHIFGERGDNRHWPDMIAAPIVTPG
jgi:general secretion pathway protein J